MGQTTLPVYASQWRISTKAHFIVLLFLPISPGAKRYHTIAMEAHQVSMQLKCTGRRSISAYTLEEPRAFIFCSGKAMAEGGQTKMKTGSLKTCQNLCVFFWCLCSAFSLSAYWSPVSCQYCLARLLGNPYELSFASQAPACQETERVLVSVSRLLYFPPCLSLRSQLATSFHD